MSLPIVKCTGRPATAERLTGERMNKDEKKDALRVLPVASVTGCLS